MDHKIYIGVDVGSESLRVGAYNINGKLIIKSSRSITVFNPLPNYYEQSSEEIWTMFLEAFQEILFRLKTGKICGLGFATTCSLVALDQQYAPIAVRNEAPDSNNIIMWMDHRAIEETRFINATRDEVLNCLGGAMSVEMEIPKILWLKNNLTRWKDIGTLMDLSDYMRWKATGTLTRSLCPATCKWNYRAPDQNSWPFEFYDKIGLGPDLKPMLGRASPYALDDRDQLRANGIFDKEILKAIATPQPKDWMNCDIMVGPSLIDAHAGTLGLLACRCDSDEQSTDVVREYYDSQKVWENLNCKMALMTGTSNCLMATSDTPINVPGVWGPYYSVVFPGKYLSEGGQSASGQALAYVINRFFDKKNVVQQRKISCPPHLPPTPVMPKNPHDAMVTTLLAGGHLEVPFKGGQALPADIGERMFGSKQCAKTFFELTQNLHVLPDFNGNRSPLADPTMLGTIVGLDLDESMTGAARLYLATLQSLALGVRHIISAMNTAGHSIKLIHTGGGLCSHNLFPKIVADATGLPVVLPDNRNNCVMLGAAIYASFTSDLTLKSLQKAMKSMSCGCEIIYPSPFAKSFYDKKYRVFLQLSDDQIKYRHIMET